MIAEIYYFVPCEFCKFIKRLLAFALKVHLVITLIKSLNIHIV